MPQMSAAAETHKPTPFVPIRPDWLALRQEEILEPELPIVDPHHHLWDGESGRYLFHDLMDDLASGHNVVATVFVECRAMYRAGAAPDRRALGETEFVNGAAAMAASGAYGPARACAAIVGNVDLRFERAREALELHVELTGGRFVGIRNGSAWHAGDEIRATSANPPPGLLMDPALRRGFAALAPLGLSFDGWLLHTQIDEFLDLARAFPDTQMVIDHVGGPIGIGPYKGRRAEVFEGWRRSMRELAGCPNVNVKLGGLAMLVGGFAYHERPVPPDSASLAADWKPYMETCIEAFGVERCMFESNFPVDKGMVSYPVLWNAFKRLAAGCSAAEKQALFSGTAARVYKLKL